MSEDVKNTESTVSQDRPERTERPERPERPSGPRPRRTYYKKKVCKFCTNKMEVDYKKPDSLRRFITERGKILPRRITGTCAKHQRMLTTEIKRSRALALLPFVNK
ncbi:MAG: 30S ribosomal protein S18 [Spirochaetaceae bacterium 4572_59]|nr:MAG: 30S ribosomal protein S18 [Spirochaetaceae bacterium 4572_59]